MSVEAVANPLIGNVAVQGEAELLAAFRQAFGDDDPATVAAATALDTDGAVIETLELDDAQKVVAALRSGGEQEAATLIASAVEAAKKPVDRPVRRSDPDEPGPSEPLNEEPIKADGGVITMQGVVVAQSPGDATNAIATYEQQCRLVGIDPAEMDACIVLYPKGRLEVPRAVMQLLSATEAQGARPTA